MTKWMAEAEQLEQVGRSPQSLPTRQLAQMAAEVRPSMSGGQEPARKKLWPTVGGKAPRKEFLNAGVVKKTWKYWPGTVALYEICWFQKSTEHRGQSVIWLLAASWLANSADLWHSPHCSGPNYHLKNIYYFGHIFKQLIPTFFKISKRNFSHFVPWTAS